MSVEEFVDHFYLAGFPLSNASKPFDSKGGLDSISAKNEHLLDLGIPHKCIAESNRTHMALVGRSYFTVAPRFAKLDKSAEITLAEGRNHW